MAISKEDVQHIAHLARILVREEELEKFVDDLGSILNYVKKLNEVNTDTVEPTSHVTGSENIMRSDDINEKLKIKNDPSAELGARKLIEAAPDTKDGYVKVKSILS